MLRVGRINGDRADAAVLETAAAVRSVQCAPPSSTCRGRSRPRCRPSRSARRCRRRWSSGRVGRVDGDGANGFRPDLGDVTSTSGPRSGVVRPPDAAAGGADVHRAALVAARVDGERGDPAGPLRGRAGGLGAEGAHVQRGRGRRSSSRWTRSPSGRSSTSWRSGCRPAGCRSTAHTRRGSPDMRGSRTPPGRGHSARPRPHGSSRTLVRAMVQAAQRQRAFLEHQSVPLPDEVLGALLAPASGHAKEDRDSQCSKHRDAGKDHSLALQRVLPSGPAGVRPGPTSRRLIRSAADPSVVPLAPRVMVRWYVTPERIGIPGTAVDGFAEASAGPSSG